ncbi:MAG: ABC transporter ATP-binding protein [Pseudomonadota bacterium]
MIRLERVSKAFRRNGIRRRLLADVSFTLPDVRGLALIGRNGAGKSTLLRVIAGTLRPDTGRVISDEQISWPMGFAGGFHPALTGAQNTRFVARLYGRDPAALTDFVARFAEIGRAFRLPVETYSSGMKARLAFAVSIGLDFDCYLVDEIIGVGDAAFRDKCRAAFRERLGNARLIMVSHNPQALAQFCEAGLVIENGRLSYHDRLKDALAAHAANLAQPVPA